MINNSPNIFLPFKSCFFASTLFIFFLPTQQSSAQSRPFQIEAGVRLGIFLSAGGALLYSPTKFITMGLQSHIETGNHTRFIQAGSSTVGIFNFNFYHSKKRIHNKRFIQIGAGYSAIRPYDVFKSDEMGFVLNGGLGAKRKRFNTGIFAQYHRKGYINISFDFSFNLLHPDKPSSIQDNP